MPKLISVLGAAAVAVLPVLGADPSAAARAGPMCFGRPATIVGTPGNDRLVGQSGVVDVIWGGGGNDFIVGGDFFGDDEVPGSAPDLLCGGPGADQLRGAPGHDRLSGGRGKDNVDGGNGADVELGNAGADVVGRGSFADADSADDVSLGGPGNDLVRGGFGADRLFGQGGADTVVDLECDGPTLVSGGGGNDSLESFASSFDAPTVCTSVSDTVLGGPGTDTAKVDPLDAVRAVEHLTVVTPPTG
jgi:hypothetical protein